MCRAAAATAWKKKTATFGIDCGKPVEDKIMEVGKAGNLGDSVTISREKNKFSVTTASNFSKRIKLESKPLKNFHNHQLSCENRTSGCITKLMEAGFEKNNLKGRSRIRFLCGPKSGKVKYLDPASVKNIRPQKPKVTICRRKPSHNMDNKCNLKISGKKTQTPVQSVIPRKRHVDDVNDCKFDDEKKLESKNDYSKKLKVMNNVVAKDVDFMLGENNEVKRLEPKELGTKSYLDKRPARKVKPRNREWNWIDPSIIGSSKDIDRREKIIEAMIIFNEVYEHLDEENRLKPEIEKIRSWRVLEDVAKIVKRKLNWMKPKPKKVIGPVYGVHVGDKFRFRLQLHMIGLHCQPQYGIDYIFFEGKNLATSIVYSQRYSNDSRYRDEIRYSGHGGLRVMGAKQQIEDQKLERGNLALKNSMDEQNPVRVIRRIKEAGKIYAYLYDGFYIVRELIQKRSEEGKIVYIFVLRRMGGQPSSLPND